MNPVRLRQIIDSRRTMRTPPLIPTTVRRGELTLRKGAKEIVDIHVHLRKFRVQKNSEKTPIACVFSKSEDNRDGPWKVSTASELTFCKSAKATTTAISADEREQPSSKCGARFVCSAAFINLPGVFAVDFHLEHCHLIKIDICELLMTGCLSLGYAMFAVSELVVCGNGSILRPLVNDETGSVIAEATISCTLRPRPHSILMQFAAKNLVKKNLLSVNSAQIFFEVHRVESTSSSPFTTMLASANPSYNNFQHYQKESGEMTTSMTSTVLFNNSNMSRTNNGTFHTAFEASDIGAIENGCLRGAGAPPLRNAIGYSALLAPTRTTTLLYRSECVKYSSSSIVWRAFTLQSNEISGRVLELVCMYRDAKTSKVSLGRFLTECEQLKKGPSPDNIYFLIYENSRNQQKTCGMFELLRITQIALPSFLEYVSTGCTLNFACAVDFSRAATLSAADEIAVRRYVDDVELVLHAIGEPLRHFNRGSNFPAFGFGAKVPPQFRESQEFCLNLETDPYCRGLDGIQNAFRSAFATVQPINIAHLSHVIYYVAKLAQSAVNRVQASNASTTAALISPTSTNAVPSINDHPSYFVLLIITRGVFDDLKETVQSIIFASRAPMSIIFVTLGDDIDSSGTTSADVKLNSHVASKTNALYDSPFGESFESPAHTVFANFEDQSHLHPSSFSFQQHVTGANELERLALAGTRLNYHGRRAERDCTQYVSLAQCRRKEANSVKLKALVAERGLLNIPWQMSAWLTKYGFKANSAIIADPILDVGVDNSAIIGKSNGTTTSVPSHHIFSGSDYDYTRKSSGVRRKSRLLAANVGAQIRQLAARRCRGGIWCRHAPSTVGFPDEDDDDDYASEHDDFQRVCQPFPYNDCASDDAVSSQDYIGAFKALSSIVEARSNFSTSMAWRRALLRRYPDFVLNTASGTFLGLASKNFVPD